MESLLPVGLVLLFVLAAEFVNGWTDAPNAIDSRHIRSTSKVRVGDIGECGPSI